MISPPRRTRGNGSSKRHKAEVVQGHRHKAGIEVVALHVLGAAGVEVDRQHPARALRVPGPVVELGRGIAQEVPGGIDERIGHVGLSSARPTTSRAPGPDEALDGGQRRNARARGPEVLHLWQQHRQILVRHGNRAAGVAVNDRDRRAPVALAGDEPVPHPVAHRRPPDSVRQLGTQQVGM